MQRRDGGFDKEAHEAQTHAMRFLELVTVLLAQRHDRGHVHFVEGGQDGVGRLRLHQSLGHPGAQAGHRNPLLRTVGQRDRDAGRRGECADGRGRRSGFSQRGRCRWRCLGCLGGQSICLGNTATASAARHGRRINAFFVENLACRRQGDPGGRGCGLDRCRRGFGRCFLGRRFGSRGRLGLGVDAGDEFIGHDAITVALDDFHQHAIGR